MKDLTTLTNVNILDRWVIVLKQNINCPKIINMLTLDDSFDYEKALSQIDRISLKI